MPDLRYISVILPLKLEWEPCYSLKPDMQVELGDRVKVNFAGKEYIGAVSRTDIIPETDPDKIRPLISVEGQLEKVSEQEIKLWRQVAEYYLCTVGEVYKAAYPGGKTALEQAMAESRRREEERTGRRRSHIIKRTETLSLRLSKKEEMLSRARKDSSREAYIREICKLREDISILRQSIEDMEQKDCISSTKTYICNREPELSSPQAKAYEGITEAFSQKHPVLLHGVTGSGKTEIYIKAACRTIAEGRNVLYLVPEIALSRQLEERLRKYFGDMLLCFHSAQTAARRRDIAAKVRKGQYIILGTRSSLFLPHHELGLIIIDEEHDSSYKQDNPAPRYNGRDTALMLSRIHNSDVILGSATPSLESLYNCSGGKYRHIRIEERYHGAGASLIEIIDTRAERAKRGMKGNFSIKLTGHIRKVLDTGGQVVILRSRRSYSPALQCSQCGEIVKCPHCNVSLSLHKTANQPAAEGRLICHHCGWSGRFKGGCSKCGGEIRLLGSGTQKIEEEAAALFPQAVIARLDSDSAQDKKYESDTIRKFSKGEIDILVGTQMISKGFDFSNLKLVVIIAADTMLAVNDFRADEKAIQLLEQLKGRSGRRGEKGMFIIQTSQPDHPVYRKILSDEVYSYSLELMQERKDFHFPPYTRIINIIIKDTYRDRLELMSIQLKRALETAACNISGPYIPMPDNIAGQHIMCMRLSLAKDRNIGLNKRKIRDIISGFEKTKGYAGHITADVDPC